jgi:hypothetical protein
MLQLCANIATKGLPYEEREDAIQDCILAVLEGDVHGTKAYIVQRMKWSISDRRRKKNFEKRIRDTHVEDTLNGISDPLERLEEGLCSDGGFGIFDIFAKLSHREFLLFSWGVFYGFQEVAKSLEWRYDDVRWEWYRILRKLRR